MLIMSGETKNQRSGKENRRPDQRSRRVYNRVNSKGNEGMKRGTTQSSKSARPSKIRYLKSNEASLPGAHTYKTRSSRTPSGGARPNRSQSNGARPDQMKQNGARTGRMQPNGARPNQMQSNGARPNRVQPGGARPGRMQPNNARPNNARPNRAQSNSARPVKGQPNRARPSNGRSTANQSGIVKFRRVIRKTVRKMSTTSLLSDHRTKGIVVAMAAVVLICLYGSRAYYYTNRFFEGTTINGVNVSGMTPYEVEQMIAEDVEDYSIEVSSRNHETQTIAGDAIKYQYAPDGQVLAALKAQNPLAWITGIIKRAHHTIPTRATYDKTLLEGQLKSLECAKAENQVPPQNAYVSYENNQFTIVPETEGSELQLKEAYIALDNAIASESPSIDLNSVPNVYASAELTSSDPVLQETLDAYNNFAKASITYTFDKEKEVLDGNTIQSWLEFDSKGEVVELEESFQRHAAEYVAKLAEKYDTINKERPFKTTSGRTVYVTGYAYGWGIDQEAEVAQLISDIRSGAVVTREPIYYMTANSHGDNDFGNTYIEVDLSSQEMYFYKDGKVIMDAPIVSGLAGDPERATPPGVFTLYYKKSPDVLRGPKLDDGSYEWEAEVSYWMPFNGGIGFHDAVWQPYFGGDMYLYNGSHGCINLSLEDAEYLYSIIDYGIPIICFY